MSPTFNRLMLEQNIKVPVGSGFQVYIAGPMRGKPMHNFQEFFIAAILLRRAGWVVFNPAEYDMAAGVNPAETDETKWPLTVHDMLSTDFKLILDQCEGIVLLPGWNNSVGAKMELAIAVHCGLRVFELTKTWEEGMSHQIHEIEIEPPTLTYGPAMVIS